MKGTVWGRGTTDVLRSGPQNKFENAINVLWVTLKLSG